MSSKNKIALVTGGSRGLGKDMALRLAERGIDVIVTYNHQKEEADKTVAEIKNKGQQAVALQLNTGDIKSFDAFLNVFKEQLETVFQTDHFDFLVNNAGMANRKSLAETTEDDFDQLMNVHFKGVFFLTQKLLPIVNDGGSIINISTGLTRFSYVGVGTYASMKSAIETFSKYLAKEVGVRNINVNVVAPGAIATDFGGGLLKNSSEMQDHMKEVTAIPRVGLASDIGGVVAFLCTDDAKWINAQRIEVSGGVNL